MNRRDLMLAAGAATVAGWPAFARAQMLPPPDLKAEARDAYIYTLPLIEMATTRKRSLTANPAQNTLIHRRNLSTPADRFVTTPNNDTVYSVAWLDLTNGPATLQIPATGARYFSVALMNMYTDNDAVLSRRTVGGAGGTFTIVGPGQAGSGPDIVRVATPHAWMLIRTLVDGPTDLDAVHAVQDGFKLTGAAATAVGAYAERAAPAPAYFESARRLLASDPPPATDTNILRHTSALTSGAAPATLPVFAEGVAEARSLLAAARGTGALVQGWSYPQANLGVFGQDYRYRAGVALWGLGALPVAEAMYMNAADETGQRTFTSDKAYRLSLPAQLPVNAFWSLSMYEVVADGQLFFTDNPLKRYAIGDRTPGLVRNADGGIDIHIARTDPGGAHSANWLPAPVRGPYAMVMRCYLPKPELLDGRWRLPPVTPA